MAQDTQARIAQQVEPPQPFAPRPPRELRAQAVHRLQVGLFGLCTMLLLVGLANIIMDRARLADEESPAVQAAAAPEGEKAATDPLADIGVVPAADPSAIPDPTKGP
jgi:hypothetical protein